MKFKIGDKIRQIKEGWNTLKIDNEKIAVVTKVGGSYIRNTDGIEIEGIDKFAYSPKTWRGEDGFELVENVPNYIEIVKIEQLK